MDAELPIFRLRRGKRPLLVSMPHVGTSLPHWLSGRMTAEALALSDTDWHLEPLYDFLEELDVSVIVATHSRYVIDLNRPPDNASLYPGKSTTGLCPIDTFDDQPLYLPGAEPDTQEISRRLDNYWRPYHEALRAELSRLKSMHDSVLLWDAHSIRPYVPRLFDGLLPDFNIGTDDHRTCATALIERVSAVLKAQDEHSCVVNGRFKGGYITRHYGRPQEGIHSMQLELSMRTYMADSGTDIDDSRARQVRPVLKSMMENMLEWHSKAKPAVR